MSVNAQFFSWQNGIQPGPPYNYFSPNLKALKEHVLGMWGGMSLGGYNVRPVRAGRSWSSHAFGAAWDWRWHNPGPGRHTLEHQVLPFLVENAAVLGVQVIHHYVGRYGGENRWQVGKGWYKANIGSGGPWLHIETTPDMWANATPVADRLTPPVPPELSGLPVFDPEIGKWSLWPLVAKPDISPGKTGDIVRYLQGVLRNKAGQRQIGPIDGVFGRLTESGVVNVQTFFNIQAPSGWVTRDVWRVVDWIAGL